MNNIVEAVGDKSSVLMALLKTLIEWPPTASTNALAAQYL